MKPSLLDKLQQLADRLEEVTHLLGSPEATSDMDNYRKLNKEHAEITPVVCRLGSGPASRRRYWSEKRMLQPGSAGPVLPPPDEP